MLFNSWTFIGLVLCTLCIYYLPFLKKKQIYILLIASAFFYAYNSLALMLLLILSAFLNSLASYLAIYSKKPRVYASIGVVINLLVLAFFKYGKLFASSFINDSTSPIEAFMINLPLPLGISFFTFSGISLVVDSFKGRYDQSKEVVQPSFLAHLKNTFFYITFFPKLLAGPIAKSRNFYPQIGSKSWKDVDFILIFKALVTGFFLKLVIADNLKDFTFWMAYPYFEQRGTGSLLLMLFGYTIQIFSDFAGYSLIAIGIAALFGYKLPTNFNYPYISASFREFWKRWHITLSNFLMEYLYISLGGNRKGKIRTYLNLLLTMMLGGLWHGAAWSFLTWGTYHGLCLVAERALCGKRENCISLGSSKYAVNISKIISIIFVFVMVSFGWLFFVLQDFSQAMLYLHCICSNFGKFSFVDPKLMPICIYVIPVVLYHLIYLFREKTVIKRYVLQLSYVFYGCMLFLILTNSGSAESFVYFQF